MSTTLQVVAHTKTVSACQVLINAIITHTWQLLMTSADSVWLPAFAAACRAGVKILEGRAQLLGPHEVQVAGHNRTYRVGS